MIERTYPLENAADAVRHLEHQHPSAKIVITMAPPSSSAP